MANVFKRVGPTGKTTWYVRYQDPISGKDIKRAVNAKTKREAEVILATLIMQIDDGIFESKQREREVRFFDIADDFMAYSKAHKRSWTRDRDSITHWKGFLGDCLVKDITPAKVEEFILMRKRTITRRGRPPEPATINRELACLRTIFNRAIHNSKCSRNPVRYVKLLKENNVRKRVLSREEMMHLLECSQAHLRPILIAAHETGMRAGEIFSLRWKQVDLKSNFITLYPEQTKTNDGRKVPISPWLHDTLAGMKRARLEDFVFLYQGRSIASIKNSFKSACKEAGIEDFRFHDFRHTFVTNMRRAGKQDRSIRAITGHKTFVAFTRYDTVSDEDLKMVVADSAP